MPHKHKRRQKDEATYDLPPTTIAKPLPVHKNKQEKKPAKKADTKKSEKQSKSTNKWADDTPRAFARLMRFQQVGKTPSGLDDGNDKKPNKKRKRGEDKDGTASSNPKSTATTAKPAESAPTLKILPGEKLSDFAARVDQAMPLSAMKKSQRIGQSENLPKIREERMTKHEKHLRKLQQGWREEEARISAKEAEERELREAENEEIEEMVRRGVGGAEVDVANIPAAAGSLRRREELAEERKSIVEEYRRLMAAKRGQ
ncbi:hypothetical protein ZTR_08561 [Talaromyces verruculosus]|nr:hypothetical protein ZTR_08561 [Talaromyces verruculosus]